MIVRSYVIHHRFKMTPDLHGRVFFCRRQPFCLGLGNANTRCLRATARTTNLEDPLVMFLKTCGCKRVYKRVDNGVGVSDYFKCKGKYKYCLSVLTEDVSKHLCIKCIH